MIALNKVPAVRFELVLDRIDETSRPIDVEGLLAPEKEPQQLVEAGEVVHMPMCNKDIADAHELARGKPAEVAEIEKQRAPLKHEIHVKTRVVEWIIDKRGVKVGRHRSSPSLRSRWTWRPRL